MEKLVVYSKKVAETLMRKGHPLLHTEKNRKNEKYLVFVFEKTESLVEDFNKLTSPMD